MSVVWAVLILQIRKVFEEMAVAWGDLVLSRLNCPLDAAELFSNS
jgi:hypothetical protein